MDEPPARADPAAGASRPSATLVALIALTGYIARLVVVFVHEVIGHGLVGMLVGGMFYDLFVSPVEGSANVVAPDGFDVPVLVGGSLAGIALGIGALAWSGRRIASSVGSSLRTLFLWCVAAMALLDEVGYVVAVPLLARIAGAATGDWLLLTLRFDLPPVAVFVAGIALAVPLSAMLVRQAHAIVGRMLLTAWDRGPFVSFALLLLPGLSLRLVYLGAFSPWMDTRLLFVLAGVFGPLSLGLLGAVWLRIRGPRDTMLEQPGIEPSRGREVALSRTPAQRADAPAGSVGWTVGLIAAGAVAMWVFGPTLELRRGVALRPADADQYISAAQSIRLALDVTERAAPRLRIESTPEPDRGPRFRRRITASLASSGPSERGAAGLATFIAQWNLDGAHVRAVTRPVLRGSSWVWDATLDALPDSLTVRLWPVTWVSESHVERLSIRGEGVRANAPSLGEDSIHVWSRPADLSAIDSFPLLIGGR